MGKKVVTLGEIMLRLSPPDYKRFTQTECFLAHFGGAEANVAVLLGNLGLDSYFVSQVPSNSIGDSALGYLRRYGVKTDYVIREGNRLGIYYFEKGTSVRPSKVVYDRANSAITEANIENFNFDEIFKEADWFHFSGITPALGENCIKIVEEAVKSAKRNNVKISVDLNYRNKLWSYEEFQEVMSELIKDADLCIGWLNTADENSGKDYKVADFSKGQLNLEYFNKIFSNMKKQYNVKNVATTLRGNYSASHNSLSALFYDGEKIYKSNTYDFHIVDRVGAGDSFAGGLIYKLVNEKPTEEALEFAVASAVFKHTVEGDANIASEGDINELALGNISGAVKR